jgi:hypothetical protein
MKETLEITIPTSWGDITLRKWLELQTDLESYKDNEEAQTASLFWHLCGIPADKTRLLPKKDYTHIKGKLDSIPTPNSLELQRLVTIGGVEYGFEPNLGEIAYGAYADLTQYESAGIDKNWGKIMSILYRPVTKKVGDMYSIQTYTGVADDTIWLDATMDIHYGAMFFFLHTSMDLYKDTLNSMTNREEIPHSIRRILAESGKLILQFTNSQMAMLKK